MFDGFEWVSERDEGYSIRTGVSNFRGVIGKGMKENSSLATNCYPYYHHYTLYIYTRLKLKYCLLDDENRFYVLRMKNTLE